MSVEQVLWGGLTLLFAVVLVALKTWINNIKTVIERLDIKVESKTNSSQCLERYADVRADIAALNKHKHAESGEVIFP